jgi:hypothetical protein
MENRTVRVAPELDPRMAMTQLSMQRVRQQRRSYWGVAIAAASGTALAVLAYWGASSSPSWSWNNAFEGQGVALHGEASTSAAPVVVAVAANPIDPGLPPGEFGSHALSAGTSAAGNSAAGNSAAGNSAVDIGVGADRGVVEEITEPPVVVKPHTVQRRAKTNAARHSSRRTGSNAGSATRGPKNSPKSSQPEKSSTQQAGAVEVAPDATGRGSLDLSEGHKVWLE